MHIHILGICGTFMGGVALLARAAGHTVTGCDANVYPPMSTQLEEQGILLTPGFDPDQRNLNPDIFVVGNAISRGNPLLEAILNEGLPYVSGPQWLAENILKGRWVLGVAGTHGKTTTTSMLTWILEDAGLNPSFLVGGVPQNFGVSARLTDSPFFVIEADEYDTAFCDKRSKFVHYHPRTLILNNLEFDHADIFADLSAIETQFHHLVRTLPQNGRIIANAKEESLHRVLARGCWSECEWFNEPTGWTSQQQIHSNEAVFYLNHTSVAKGQLPMPGTHNRENALAAIAAARHVGVTPNQSVQSLERFKGIRRRLELRGEVNSIRVYDDFAHHPTAIALTLSALRNLHPDGRILAVLEPRSNTMKLGTMKALLPDALKTADAVFCYTKGLEWDAKDALAPLGKRANCYDNLEELVSAVCAFAKPKDHIIVMSNGGFGNVHTKLLHSL